MSSFRYCTRDHNNETPINEYYSTDEVCSKCEHFDPKIDIQCKFYIIKMKKEQAQNEALRKEKFLQSIEELKSRIEEKDKLILEARRTGHLGKATSLIANRLKLEEMLEQKELIKERYFE